MLAANQPESIFRELLNYFFGLPSAFVYNVMENVGSRQEK